MKREEKEREEKTNLKTARYFPVYLPLNNSSTDDRAMFKKKRKKILEQSISKRKRQYVYSSFAVRSDDSFIVSNDLPSRNNRTKNRKRTLF